MTELLHAPGFLGTNANWGADMTLIVSILVATLFTIGVVMAVRQKYEVHRWLQTTAATINAILVIWLMILPFRDFVASEFLGPRPDYFYYVTAAHAFVGFFALTFGVFVTLRGNELMIKPLKFNNYKLFMRISYSLYMLTTLLGIAVYITWFVLIPNPPLYE